MRLLALAGLLALAVSAHADLLPSNYNVSINGANSGSLGTVTNGFASIPNVGVVRFAAYLTPTTVNFSFDNGHIYGPPNPSLQVSTVDFGGHTADYITGFKLDPSSTITGIVPTTSVATTPPGLFIPFTQINFDFTNANVFAGGTATFDLTFAPQSAPEIDPSLTSSGLVLIAGGIAILRGRRTRLPT